MKGIKKFFTNRTILNVLGLLMGLFVGEVGAMRMSPAGVQRTRAFLAKQNASKSGRQVPSKTQQTKTNMQKEQELKEAFMSNQELLGREREKQDQSGKYFVYEQGTSNGIWVDQAFLDSNSSMVKEMKANVVGELKEILVPFSSDIIKLSFDAFNKKGNSKTLSLEQLGTIMNVGDYLAMSDVIMDKIFFDYIDRKKLTLEDLVDYFNKNLANPNRTKAIVFKIFSLFTDICWTFYDQFRIDKFGNTAFVPKKDNFVGYSGAMIPARVGPKALSIPDYKKLNDLNSKFEGLVKNDYNFELPKDLLKELSTFPVTPWNVKGDYGQSENAIKDHFTKDRLVGFLSAIQQHLDSEYKKSSSFFSRVWYRY